MIEFVESPIYDNWFKKHYPKKKLLICTPYIKQGALDRILELYDVEGRCSELQIQVLIRGANKEFTVNKSSDISILDSFMNLKDFNIDNMKRVKNLHMKAYLVDEKYLLITSGNLTNSGMFVLSGQENFEGGIATDDEETIRKFLRYFQGIWDQGQCLEDFYEELFQEYTDYIARDYSDHETIRRIKREAYLFEQQTVFDKQKSRNQIIEIQYSLDDLPPAGNLEYIEDTLQILKANPEGLSYVELGRKLRGVHEREDLDNVTNNRKYGEEKGKFAAYFGLAILSRGSSNLFTLSNLGKRYLEMDEANRKRYLKDQIFSKPAIRAIIKESGEPDFNLNLYLNELYPGTESTLARKRGPIVQLISFIREMDPDDELNEILDKIQ